MSKFATVLLKILMVISFVGVIVFVAFAIISNQNVSFEAYSYIASSYENVEFSKLESDVNSNMKSSYNGEVDGYAKYINKAISELNKGNKFFLDYLSIEKDLTKGEQDKLKSLYNNYISKFNICQSSYNDYIDAYEEADYKYHYDYDNSKVARSIVVSKCINFVENYTNCYVSGSNFFKYLVQVVNKYSLQNNGFSSFTEQSYLIKVGIVDNTTSFVYSNMQNKKQDMDYEIEVRNNDLVDAFYDFVAREATYKTKNALTDSSFQAFIINLNCLNIYEFAGNYDAYFAKLKKEEIKTKCAQAHEYFVSHFRG